MTVKIRKGIFETNSSSSHSLTLSNKKVDVLIDEKEFAITLGDGEYGWGGDDLTTWIEKSDYLAVDLEKGDKEKHMLTEAIKMKYPNVALEFSDQGYIDHQSSGDCWGYLESVNDVFNFLFGDGIVEIDNDN